MAQSTEYVDIMTRGARPVVIAVCMPGHRHAALMVENLYAGWNTCVVTFEWKVSATM